MVTNRIIKHMVENYMRIEDLSKNTRKRAYVDSRAVYFTLCRRFSKNNSYALIGESVKRNHATVIHGEKLFSKLYDTPTFETMSEMYDELSTQLSIMKDEPEEISKIQEIHDIKSYYRVKHITLIDKSHSVISTLTSKLNLLTKNELINKILTLDAQEIEELEHRLEVFFKVKEHQKLKQNETT